MQDVERGRGERVIGHGRQGEGGDARVVMGQTDEVDGGQVVEVDGGVRPTGPCDAGPEMDVVARVEEILLWGDDA